MFTNLFINYSVTLCLNWFLVLLETNLVGIYYNQSIGIKVKGAK